jgi:hypothetical protein
MHSLQAWLRRGGLVGLPRRAECAIGSYPASSSSSAFASCKSAVSNPSVNQP